MAVRSEIFLKKAEKVSFDKEHRDKIRFNIGRYHQAVENGKSNYVDLELAKRRLWYQKNAVINNLDHFLEMFEKNFVKNGGKVIWAKNSEDAIREILAIIKRKNAKQVVKSKSMTTEEIDLNHALEKEGIQSIETDLGEFIVQAAGEKPYHIVTPAMHKSKEDVARLFHEKFNIPEGSSPEYITDFVRGFLRNKFRETIVGITGANFLIANSGAVALTENEGNGLMSTSFPKVHIAIAGIEKVLPSIEDLDLVWSVLAEHGTGQKITAYNSLFFGPKKESEIDGPEEMYVILLDNGRSSMLLDENFRKGLTCIRCGACLNYCPIYKNIGGYTYDTTYSGPIGSFITPHLKGFEEYGHLSFASSLCGKCAEVCPVKIDIPDLLLRNRKKYVGLGLTKSLEKMAINRWEQTMLSRKKLNMTGGSLKNLTLKLIGKKAWGNRRYPPRFPSKSFNKLWDKD